MHKIEVKLYCRHCTSFAFIDHIWLITNSFTSSQKAECSLLVGDLSSLLYNNWTAVMLGSNKNAHHTVTAIPHLLKWKTVKSITTDIMADKYRFYGYEANHNGLKACHKLCKSLYNRWDSIILFIKQCISRSYFLTGDLLVFVRPLIFSSAVSSLDCAAALISTNF